MTETGTLNKFSLLLVLMVAAASYTWKLSSEGQSVLWWIIGGLITATLLTLLVLPAMSRLVLGLTEGGRPKPSDEAAAAAMPAE